MLFYVARCVCNCVCVCLIMIVFVFRFECVQFQLQSGEGNRIVHSHGVQIAERCSTHGLENIFNANKERYLQELNVYDIKHL